MLGRFASPGLGNAAGTTRSVKDGIPTPSVGTRDGGYVVAFSKECPKFNSRLYPGSGRSMHSKARGERGMGIPAWAFTEKGAKQSQF
jgi:hypothetical protein